MTNDPAEHLRLRDGRMLGWATYGDPAGRPLMAFHGSPDSHIIWKLADNDARRHGLRLIAPDRPGFGLSDPQPRRTVLDWPADALALADHLAIPRFPIVAISAGAAFAAACAWRHPERVTGLGLLSSISPLNHAGPWTVWCGPRAPPSCWHAGRHGCCGR